MSESNPSAWPVDEPSKFHHGNSSGDWGSFSIVRVLARIERKSSMTNRIVHPVYLEDSLLCHRSRHRSPSPCCLVGVIPGTVLVRLCPSKQKASISYPWCNPWDFLNHTWSIFKMKKNENKLKNAALFDIAQANLYIGRTAELRSHDMAPSRVFFLFSRDSLSFSCFRSHFSASLSFSLPPSRFLHRYDLKI